jgi:adenylate cyclase, class 2
MAIEIEKKFHLKPGQAEKIIRRLKKLGAEYKGKFLERNYLHKGGVLDGKAAFLRLRKINKTAVLTYKEQVVGKNKNSTDSDIKQKLEFETSVGNVAEMEAIIEKLGYKLTLYYEKKRKVYHLPGAEVVIDELPFGVYMEIEGSEKTIAKIEKLLEMPDLVPEPMGYPGLTVKHGKLIKGVHQARFVKV